MPAYLSSGDERSQCPDVYLELYHTYLPVLETAGLVDYDRNDGVVTLAASRERVTRLIERAGQIASV